ncbi:amidohydrolase [Mesorhizobium sp. BR1-1-16]|uniref:amidohydrolase n=1 Tax=Mesorhizobium sp. BR1-1-16 TaxID=2876653 RepID=UPI001CCC21F6|nr:amidohydrolase [Mesorhizobium sp. BR1-1-16]MBZ9939060.1 amidohydrolase [Mesorhizobium sp. BR1-1-16]
MCINCGLNEVLGAFVAANPGPLASRFAVSRRGFVRGALACTAALGASSIPAFAATDGKPTFIFRGGKVYTQNDALPWAEAVAVDGKTIMAVGTNDEIDKLKGPSTKVVELDGRLVLPGFVEGHIHPFLGSFLTSGVDLQLPDLDAVIAAIDSYAKAHPKGPIRGFGWRVDMFPPEGPTRQILDKIISDRPAFFFAIDGHSLWANTKALEIAGINKDTPDPIPRFSFYARDSDGYPTGYALEVNAVLQLVNAVQPIAPAAMGQLMEEWLPKASAAGITAIFDAGVPPIGSDQAAVLSMYTNLDKQGRLPFRVVGSYIVKSPPVDTAVKELEALQKTIKSELVEISVMKIVGDGVQGGYTAWLVEPYADRPDYRGGSPFSLEEWHSLVGATDAAGYDVHIHACGEGTARMGLDAIEKAIATNPPRERRHTIAHLVYVTDEDMPRFGKLGVNSQFSANWFSADPDTLINMKQRYGARADLMYRAKSALEAGGTISFGTDWPAAGYFSTYKPLDSIQIAVTRQLIGNKDNPILVPLDERLSLAEAVHANTMGAARQIRLDDKIGSIEAGKMADLLVLERNIFEGDVHDIASTRIDLTLMNGKIVHGSA